MKGCAFHINAQQRAPLQRRLFTPGTESPLHVWLHPPPQLPSCRLQAARVGRGTSTASPPWPQQHEQVADTSPQSQLRRHAQSRQLQWAPSRGTATWTPGAPAPSLDKREPPRPAPCTATWTPGAPAPSLDKRGPPRPAPCKAPSPWRHLLSPQPLQISLPPSPATLCLPRRLPLAQKWGK